MLYCIAMAVGVILGGACAIFAQMQSARDPSAEPQDDTRKLPQDDKENKPQDDAEREKLQKQWENFINYGGSADGQVEVES